jgi:hypothetical protein
LLALHCLEDPGGQYGWIEDAVDAPITETIADLLSEEPSQ